MAALDNSWQNDITNDDQCGIPLAPLYRDGLIPYVLCCSEFQSVSFTWIVVVLLLFTQKDLCGSRFYQIVSWENFFSFCARKWLVKHGLKIPTVLYHKCLSLIISIFKSRSFNVLSRIFFVMSNIRRDLNLRKIPNSINKQFFTESLQTVLGQWIHNNLNFECLIWEIMHLNFWNICFLFICYVGRAVLTMAFGTVLIWCYHSEVINLSRFAWRHALLTLWIIHCFLLSVKLQCGYFGWYWLENK